MACFKLGAFNMDAVSFRESTCAQALSWDLLPEGPGGLMRARGIGGDDVPGLYAGTGNACQGDDRWHRSCTYFFAGLVAVAGLGTTRAECCKATRKEATSEGSHPTTRSSCREAGFALDVGVGAEGRHASSVFLRE